MPDSADSSPDQPRPVATDRDYLLSLEQVAERYVASGHPRTIRTLQRYCANGHLDCQKVQTTLGDKYLVAPYSIARHVAQINEVIAFTDQATRRDQPRPAATLVALQHRHDRSDTPAASLGDQPRPVATEPDNGEGGVAHHVASRALERLEEENTFLRDQIRTKDRQIDSLLERDRETNILVRGLQEMLTPLLGPRRSEPREDDSEASM